MRSDKKFYVLTCIPAQFPIPDSEVTKLMIHSTTKASRFEAYKAIKAVAETADVTGLDVHAIAFRGMEDDMLQLVYDLKENWTKNSTDKGYLVAWDYLKSERLDGYKKLDRIMFSEREDIADTLPLWHVNKKKAPELT